MEFLAEIIDRIGGFFCQKGRGRITSHFGPYIVFNQFIAGHMQKRTANLLVVNWSHFIEILSLLNAFYIENFIALIFIAYSSCKRSTRWNFRYIEILNLYWLERAFNSASTNMRNIVFVSRLRTHTGDKLSVTNEFHSNSSSDQVHLASQKWWSIPYHIPFNSAWKGLQTDI